MNLHTLLWVLYLVPAVVGLLMCAPELTTRYCERYISPTRWPNFVRNQANDSKRGFECWLGLTMLVPVLGTAILALLLRGALYFAGASIVNWIRRRFGMEPLDIC